MKKTLLITSLLAFIFVGLKAQDNEESAFKNSLRISPFHFFNSTFLLQYEHEFPRNQSLVVSGGVRLKQDTYEEKLGWQAELGYRVYFRPMKKVVNFFCGPYAGYSYLQVNDVYASGSEPYDETQKFNAINAGVLGGLRFTFAERFCMDISFGGGMQYTKRSPDIQTQEWPENDFFYDPGYTGIIPKANFSLGIKF